MFTWERIVGILLLVYAGYVISKGRMVSSDDNRANAPGWVDRKKNPVRFWFAVGLMILMAGLLISGIVHY